MSEITRYRQWCSISHGHQLDRDAEGEYVRYSDHLAALAANDGEIARLAKERNEARDEADKERWRNRDEEGLAARDANQRITAELERLKAEVKYEADIVDRCWKELGIDSYKDAGGKSIYEHIKLLKQQLYRVKDILAFSTGNNGEKIEAIRKAVPAILCGEPELGGMMGPDEAAAIRARIAELEAELAAKGKG